LHADEQSALPVGTNTEVAASDNSIDRQGIRPATCTNPEFFGLLGEVSVRPAGIRCQ
jgi:hypothetical protein